MDLPDPGQLALMIPLAGIGTGALAIFLKHQQRMAEIRARAGMEPRVTNTAENNELRTEIAELRDEVRKLRDTSTKFDLSFDAGLTRLEERVERMEAEKAAGTYTPTRNGTATGSSEQNVLTVGQGQ